MKKRAVVLMDEQYHVLEGWYPVYRLREAGVEVQIVGRESGATVLSKCGYPAVIDRSANELTADDFDCLVIPGGYAADFLRREPYVVDLVANAMAKGCIVAVICHGGWLLSSANAVTGRRLTSFIAIRDDLVHAGGLWEDSTVVCDGNLITSRGPDDLPEFMAATVDAVMNQLAPAG